MATQTKGLTLRSRGRGRAPASGLKRQLWISSLPLVVLLLCGALGLYFQLPDDGSFWLLIGYLVVSLVLGLGSLLLGAQRGVLAPLQTLRETIAKIRPGAGPLPRELPLNRMDVVGEIAREVAMLAGDRNVSELRRDESERTIDALADAISDAIFRVNRDGLLLSAQQPKDAPPFLDFEAIPGKRMRDVFPPRAALQLSGAAERVLEDGSSRTIEYEHILELEKRNFEARLVRANKEEVLIILRDVTRVKLAHAYQDRLTSILDATPDPVFTADLKGDVRYVNPAGRHLLAIREERGFSIRRGDFLPEWARKEAFRIAVPTAVEEGLWKGESALLTTDGVEIPVSLIVLAHKSNNNTVDYLSFIARDMRERKRFDDHLLFLADHDPLTSLFSRRRFVEELGREIAKAGRSGEAGAVLLMDLDDFKYVNDSLGHRAGDKLLVSLARLVRGSLRATDMLARLGGDEFGILLPETGAEQVDLVTERLLKAVRNHSVVLGEQPVGVTTSIGIAYYPEHGTTAEKLLSRADQAMFRAKDQGRDQFVEFKPDKAWQADVDSRLAGEKRIRDALARGRFLLFAQPILDLETDKIVQFEILLRMRDEQNNIMPPAAFLSTAERFGLIRSVDRWVVRRAIQLIGNYAKAGSEVRLSVNLSGKSLADLELVTLIEKELSANSVDPRSLTLEITETAAIADTDRAQKFADALKQIGCRLALDDFGVGFSSLNHLKHLPVDYLKIDGSFIRELPKNKVDQHLVRAMVEIARALRKRTVAEFVTDQETMDLLKNCGVDFAQGYHIGKPAAVEDMLPSEAATAPATPTVTAEKKEPATR